MRYTLFCFLFFIATDFAAHAQGDTLTGKRNSIRSSNYKAQPGNVLDSVVIAMKSRQQFVADSIAMFYLKPEPKREDKFVKEIWKTDIFHVSRFSITPLKAKQVLKAGKLREFRDPWILAVIAGLLIFTGLLNLFLSKDIQSVIQSFYNKHAISQVDKDGGLVNSWAFVGLFLLFSLTFGLALYQFTVYKDVYYSISGFRLFITLSLIIGLLFALKFVVLKFIGFVFDISSLVSQYIAILNLTYFSIAFVLLAVVVCFSLISKQFIYPLLIFTLAAIAIIFAWQYLRNSVNVISNIRFHKFYLFIYLCALEICPILILIKALNI